MPIWINVTLYNSVRLISRYGHLLCGAYGRSQGLDNKLQLTLLSRFVGSTPLFALGRYQHYGQLVQELIIPIIDYYTESCDDGEANYDVEMQDYKRIAPVLKYCARLKALDLHTCMGMRGIELERLFVNNPLTCLALTSLDISRSRIQASSMLSALAMLPNLEKLVLSGTDVNDSILLIISKIMLDLEWLEIDGCDVTDAGIQELVEACPKLTYLQTNRWDDTDDCDWVRQINSRGGWVSLIRVDDDDKLYELPDEYDLYDVDWDENEDYLDDPYVYDPYTGDVVCRFAPF
ncbi:hypothetical protein GGH93_005793 [Coemansia aciculifera]|nr:hypothetical protein GGH93_005793 [Coemansia aciculifera]